MVLSKSHHRISNQKRLPQNNPQRPSYLFSPTQTISLSQQTCQLQSKLRCKMGLPWPLE
ncbi:hypothetical protein NC653_003428 [Populus alba x Populus x berolinensis]|uniref:Uncharacterized protein n=1 Tax=Populus alba x Populus x berolinensis TaxID=444605 RepID=A0AAD6RRK1_9ROSI|nr:hypothetical protein NC653_003428 [Populus alba x Populus x berolinensis]